jgi:hypothetical protein
MKALVCVTAFVCALVGCSESNTNAPVNTEAMPTSANGDAEYFTFAIDGKPMQIAPEEISTSMRPSGELLILAGAYRELSITLTIPDIAHCPCVVAAGATDPASPIGQGSVSLQGYPTPANGLNSWYVGQLGTPAENAIAITDLGTREKVGRYLSGTFHTTVLKTESNGDGPENRDYVITEGRFRVLHEIVGTEPF